MNARIITITVQISNHNHGTKSIITFAVKNHRTNQYSQIQNKSIGTITVQTNYHRVSKKSHYKSIITIKVQIN